MRWAVGLLLAVAAFLFAANFVFLTKPAPKGPPPVAAPVPPEPVVPPPAPPPPPPPPTTAVLTGRVLTADEGTPVAGAVIDCDGRRPFVRSGPDGSYRLEGILPGRRSIGAFPEGYAYASRWMEFSAGEAARLDLYVLRGADIEGTVLSGGSPVPGATVSVYEGTKSAVTGKDGTFVLRGFRPQGEFLDVSAAGFPPQTFGVEVPPGEARVPCVLELRPAWKVVGTVLLDGRPVAGARVAEDWRGIAGEAFAGAISAADGTFVLESAGDLQDGVVWAWKEGAGPGCSEEIDLADGTTLDAVAVELPAGFPVTVSVVDEAGAPVAGAAVEARLEAEAVLGLPVDSGELGLPYRGILAATGAAGTAVLPLHQGRWDCRVRAAGFFAGVFACGGEEPAPADPVVLRRGGDLEGTVVDGEGRPVEGASVAVRGSGTWDPPPAVTGTDGRFLFRSMKDEEHWISARKGGFSGGPASGLRPGTPATITLRPASTIRGRVLLADGRTPARAFTVRLWYEATEDGTPWKDQGWPFRTEEVFDADGRFDLPDVEPGTIGVEAERGDLLTPRVSLATRPGKDPAEIVLVLRTGGSVAGRVLDPAGLPVAGVPVSLGSPWRGSAQPEEDDEWAETRQGETGPDGRFRFLVLQPGRYRVRADREGCFERRLAVRVAASSAARAELVLEKGGALRLECVDEAGRPVDWDSLDFLRGQGDEERTVEAMRGEERFATTGFTPAELDESLALALGSYRARITAEGYLPAEVRVVVKEGETTTVKAVLKKSP